MIMRRLVIFTIMLGLALCCTVLASDSDVVVPDGKETESLQTSKAGETIDWQVISSGGSKGTSAGYSLTGTAGQTATGTGSSASYGMSHGFWQATTEGSYCVPGDANESGGVDIDDVVYLISYIFSGGPPPVPEICCGDANGSYAVDIDDVVYLIAYIFSGGPEPVDGC